MEGLLLLLQVGLLVAAGVMVWRVREELQLLVKQATAGFPEEQLHRLNQELQQTLREVRQAVSEGVAQLEERIARAEQVLQQLQQHLPEQPAAPSDEKPKLPVDQIIALSERGYSVEEIARLTGVAAGEVALLLQLRTQRRTKRAATKHSEQGEENETRCEEA